MSERVQITNESQDKFLFVFTPKILAYDCCCGCSIRTGVQIISLLFIFASLSNFMTAIELKTSWQFLTSLIAFTLYFVASVSLMISSFTLNSDYAKLGYYLFSGMFIFSLIDSLIFLILILTGQYEDTGSTGNRLKIAIIFIVLLTITLSIQLYMIWIVFSFYIHLKHERFTLISGNVTYIFESNQQPLLNDRQNINV